MLIDIPLVWLFACKSLLEGSIVTRDKGSNCLTIECDGQKGTFLIGDDAHEMRDRAWAAMAKFWDETANGINEQPIPTPTLRLVRDTTNEGATT